MKTRNIAISIGALALILGLAVSQEEVTPQEPEPQKTRAELLELRVTILEKELLQIQSYLREQASCTERFLHSLDEVEKLGFVPGINWKSREVLLASLRDRLAAVRSGLPEASPEPAKGVEPAPAEPQKRR